MKLIKTLFLLGLALGLSACASNVVVESDIPIPLMQKLPLSAKLQFSEEFLNYTHEETDKRRKLDTLNLGQAQADLFRTVFSSALTLLDDPNAPSDLIITPQILGLQYSEPRESTLNVYEVFLRYRITIDSPEQGEIADWVIKGYGKTPTAILSNANSAFSAATNVALRDVGAQISIGLPLQSSIKQFVANRANAVSTQASQTSGVSGDTSETQESAQ